MARRAAATFETCPFIDEGDERCASHFTLDHLSQALSECAGGYRGCTHYWRLLRSRPERLIAITTFGRAMAATGS